jgi:hypothetical protein
MSAAEDKERALAVAAKMRDANAAEAAKPRIPLVRFSTAQILGDIEPEKYALPGVPEEAFTLISGGLSSYKTTLLLYLMAWKATGCDALGLDEEGHGIDLGKVVLLTYEDTKTRMFAKWQRVVQDCHRRISAGLGREDAERFAARVAQNFTLIPISGRTDLSIVSRLEGGRIVRNDWFLHALVEDIQGFAPEGAMIGIDPLRLAIVGSQNDDDGADIAVHVLNWLSAAVPGSALVVCTHTNKAVAQQEGVGTPSHAAASYATAGSALYSQHARSNFHMARLGGDQARKLFAREAVSREEATRERVVRLTHGRLSHGEESSAVYLAMGKGILRRVKPTDPKQTSAEQIIATDGPTLLEAVQRIASKGVRVTGTALEKDGALGEQLDRAQIRDALKLLVQNGHITKEGTTTDLNHAITDKGRELLAAQQAIARE